MDILVNVLQSGWEALREYLSAHVITCLVNALFIAGAIANFVSQGAILKYFGPAANKMVSYTGSRCFGTVLAVCSCTVLPLLAASTGGAPVSDRRSHFSYSGPALTSWRSFIRRVLGYDIGIARIAGAAVFRW
jgi:uncharacterized membrane protein YraQ (UPF0718 family)